MAFSAKMNEIIKKHTNQQWCAMNSNEICKPIPLSSTDRNYVKFKIAMQKDFLKEFLFVRRIQNPILYEQFMLKFAECKRLNSNVDIKELYHSTSTETVDEIMDDNLDWRLCKRVKYGKGISFSPDPSYANLQSRITNGRLRAMIVADVIVGYLQVGGMKTVIPDNGYDTTVSENNTVYVKYNDYEYYPKFVIYYETYKVKKGQNGERFIDRQS